jgi:hypothetical protein
MRAVDTALPVVEVVEHLRTFRDRIEEIAELAERTWTNDVPVVLDDRIAVRALADEHAEMILPEVRHDFLELSFALDGPHDARGHNLAGESLRDLLRATEEQTIATRIRDSDDIGRRASLVDALLDFLRVGMIREQFERSLALRLHSRQHAFRECVWNALGIELHLDPPVDAE